jgi:hypothetical protein
MADDTLSLPLGPGEARRRCRKCWVAKPIDEFERKGTSRNRSRICKGCRNAMHRNDYAIKPTRKASLDRWIARNPEKRKTYAANNYERVRSDLHRSLAKTLDTTRAYCKRKGIPFSIDASNMVELHNLQLGTCALTGRELIWGAKGVQRDSISIDRIEPASGYVAGNVRLITFQANMARGPYPDAELIAFCEAVLATRAASR